MPYETDAGRALRTMNDPTGGEAFCSATLIFTLAVAAFWGAHKLSKPMDKADAIRVLQRSASQIVNSDLVGRVKSLEQLDGKILDVVYPNPLGEGDISESVHFYYPHPMPHSSAVCAKIEFEKATDVVEHCFENHRIYMSYDLTKEVDVPTFVINTGDLNDPLLIDVAEKFNDLMVPVRRNGGVLDIQPFRDTLVLKGYGDNRSGEADVNFDYVYDEKSLCVKFITESGALDRNRANTVEFDTIESGYSVGFDRSDMHQRATGIICDTFQLD